MRHAIFGASRVKEIRMPMVRQDAFPVFCILFLAVVLPAQAAPRATPSVKKAPALQQSGIQQAPSLTDPAAASAGNQGVEFEPTALSTLPGGSVEKIEGRPSSVQIQVRLLSDKLAAAFKDRPGNGRYERWAVVPFENQGKEAEKRKLGEVIGAEVESRLKGDHGLVLVERMQISRVLQEMQLVQVGLVTNVDGAEETQMGKMLDAQVLVTGTVGQLGDKYVVNARVVSVEEAKVLASAQVTIEADELIALSSDAVVLRSKSDAVFRSALIPGWGQFYNRQQAKGTAIMITTAALLGGGITFYVLGSQTETAYQGISQENLGPCDGRGSDQLGACVEAQRVLAESRYGISRALFIGAGAVYAYNLLDAWLSGYSPSSAESSRYAEALRFDVAPGWAGVSGQF